MDRFSFRKICFQTFIFFNAFFLLFSTCYAQQPAKLRTFKLEKLEKGLKLYIEHSKPPINISVEESKFPHVFFLNIIGSEVTFRKYENIPIEIPVDYHGVKKIIVEEKREYDKKTPDRVQISIRLDRSFTYDIDSQWNGQFVELVLLPASQPDPRAHKMETEKKITPSKRLEKIKEFKEIEAEKAKERFDKFTRIKRVELIKKESKEKLTKIRERAKKRMEAAEPVEDAYKKLKAESEISSLPIARQQIAEKALYKDVTIPSEVKPVITRSVPGRKITRIEDCINTAFEAHLPLKIAREQEKLAELRVREARRSFYPAVMGEWKESDGNTVTEPYRGRSYAVQAEQQLFTGGKLTATLRKEQLGELIARGNVERIKQELIMKVSKAYYELVMAKNTLDIMRRTKKNSEAVLNQVEKEFAVFSATPTDLLNAQSSYNQACFQVSYAERAVAMAKLALEKEMFTENINVDDIDYTIHLKKIETALDECLDLAFRNRIELRIMDNSIKAAKFSRDIIKSEEMPNISIVGMYGRSGEAFSQRNLRLATEWSLMGKARWFLGGNTVETSYKKDKVSPFRVTKTDTNIDEQVFNAKFSFWDNLAHFSKAKEAQITRKQALKDMAEMRNKIRQETEDAYYTYLRYSTQLSLAVNQIGFRRKQLEILKVKRKMNEARGSEVIDAEIQLAEANASMQEALAGINVAIVSLNHAIGIINYFN